MWTEGRGIWHCFEASLVYLPVSRVCFCDRGMFRIPMFILNYFKNPIYMCQNLIKQGRFDHTAPHSNLSIVLLGMGWFLKVHQNEWPRCWNGGMCIPCFQVHSVIEIGFWMVVVDHCVFCSLILARFLAGGPKWGYKLNC